MDSYTRFILTVIAMALVAIAIRAGSPITPAWASDMDCRISGSIEVSRFSDTLDVKVTDFSDKLEISNAFNEAGTSSSRPMYVQTVD